MPSQRDHRNFVKGYQEALVDIIGALDEGGVDGAIDWIRNNGTESTRATLESTLALADYMEVAERVRKYEHDHPWQLPSGDYIVTSDNAILHRSGEPVSLTEEQQRIMAEHLRRWQQAYPDLSKWLGKNGNIDPPE